MSNDDLELLRQYARRGSDEAFATLVNRHLNLVYSVALRVVRSPELAEEVAQSVFTDLARNADNMKPDTILTAWLYRVTHRTAVDVVRRESCRQGREQTAVQIAAAHSPFSEWTQIEPLLEEAMEALEESDRAAILLRHYENKSLREVGQTLGISEDAAQKRVSRAVDHLREYFSKCGVVVGSAGLVALLSAHAVQAAPAGLGAAIAAAAVLSGTALHSATTIGVTKAIAMTTTQKILIAATTAGLAVTAGTSVYETHRVSQIQEQLVALQQQQEPLAQQVEQLRRERDDAKSRLEAAQQQIAQLRRDTAELPRLRGEVTRLQADAQELAQLKAGNTDAGSGSATEAEMKSWLARVGQLKGRLEQTPEARIPEFQFLTEQDWLNAARDKLETDEDYRRAFASLRNAGAGKFSPMMQQALAQYMKANNGQFPADLSQLQPYFKSPVDDAVLQRYAIVPAANLPNTKIGGDWIITPKALVDEEYDSIIGIGPNGWGVSSVDILGPVRKAFTAANGGQEATDPSQLLPYARTPSQQAAVQKWIQNLGTNYTQQGIVPVGK